MSDLDKLINEKFVPLKKRAIDSQFSKHPHIFSVINKFLSGKNNRAGLKVTENGTTVGEYTFVIDSLHHFEVQNGVLSPEIHHPFGVIKPYGIIEKSVLEEMLEEEESFIDEPFSTMRKYMRDITVRFL